MTAPIAPAALAARPFRTENDSVGPSSFSEKPSKAGRLSIFRFVLDRTDAGAESEKSFRVGSLQKAWVLKGWAESHPDDAVPLPRVLCDAAPRCWLRSGHGEMGLRAATAISCNAYFRRLARETPEPVRRSALRAAGFEVPARLSADSAIGLERNETEVTIRPARLLASYSELIRIPWLARDEARREWLDGMRDAAEEGTALRLPFRGLLAKTGTVPAQDGPRWNTSGWALVFDPAGASGWLGFLPHGSGAEAAAALGAALATESPGLVRKEALAGLRGNRPPRKSSPSRGYADAVRVRLFDALSVRGMTATNLGAAPARREGAANVGWVGVGATVSLAGTDRLGPSRWTLALNRYGLRRVVRGSFEFSGNRMVLVSGARDFVEGVIRGELRHASPDRAEELGAAILRFLAQGARHGSEDVCDLSHCARFVGEGPDIEWISPTRAQVVESRSAEPNHLDDAAWERVQARALRSGPALWSAHCGGEPLSSRAVWGAGSDSSESCPRHSRPVASWSRFLPQDALDRAFGVTAVKLTAVEQDGVRRTEVSSASSNSPFPSGAQTRFLLYDEIHRALAPSLSWDALPSPPDRYVEVPGGFRAEGRGSGHRVGLCLAE